MTTDLKAALSEYESGAADPWQDAFSDLQNIVYILAKEVVSASKCLALKESK
jgi:hypothetical protein